MLPFLAAERLPTQEELIRPFSWNDLPQQSGTARMWLGLPYLVIAAGLAWRYGATNLSWRDRVVAEPPNHALQM